MLSSTTGPAVPLGNDLIFPLYGLNSVPGYYFGNVTGHTGFPSGAIAGFLELVGSGSPLSFTYLGAEAGNKNQFVAAGVPTKTTPGGGTDVTSVFYRIGFIRARRDRL